MALKKLESVDAFVVRDLDPETPAIGIVRSAPKILQSGAKELARSQTYQCAILDMEYQGASCGVNAEDADRDQALAGFCTELLPQVESGALMIDAAKGVSAEQLAPLSDADVRDTSRLSDVNGVPATAHLLGSGAVAAARTARSLDGATVAIENFDEAGLAVASAAIDAGAKVMAISTSAGAAISSVGFELDLLRASWETNGAGMIAVLADEHMPFWKVLGAPVDVLFAGSKAGLIDHENGENIQASLVVPTGPIPYTTKGALTLERRGVTVLPDFITTAGGLLAGFPRDGAAMDVQEASIVARIEGLISAATGGEKFPILQACLAAEEFLRSWRDELPFGRPFA